MKKKLLILLLSALFITTGTSHIKSADSHFDLNPIDQVEAKTSNNLKFDKPETITLKADNKVLSEYAKMNQRDLILKYREKAVSDPNYVENPRKEIYGQDSSTNGKATHKKETKRKEVKTTKNKKEVKKENTSKAKTTTQTIKTKSTTQAVKTKRKNVQKTQTKKPVRKNTYIPNSITFNGNSVRFQQSAFNYFENESVSENEADRRFNVVTNEIRNKNVSLGPAFSGTDGQATYILGHNPGTMSKIAKLKMGDVFQVTDAAGKTFKYKVIDHADTSISYDFVNGHGYGGDPFYYGWDGEAVFIQYCINGESQVYMGVPVE